MPGLTIATDANLATAPAPASYHVRSGSSPRTNNTAATGVASSSSRASSPTRPPISPITPTLGPSQLPNHNTNTRRISTTPIPPPRNPLAPPPPLPPSTSTSTATATTSTQPDTKSNNNNNNATIPDFALGRPAFTHSSHPAQQPSIPPPPAQPIIDFDNNPDVLALKSSITILQLQRARAIADMQALNRAKTAALADPEAFVADLVTGKISISEGGGHQPASLFNPAPPPRPHPAVYSSSEGDDDDDDDDDDSSNSDSDSSSSEDDSEAGLDSESGDQQQQETKIKSEHADDVDVDGGDGSITTTTKAAAAATNPNPKQKRKKSRSGGGGRKKQKEGDEGGLAAAWRQLPKPQNVVRCPPINWSQYGVVGESLDKLHAEQLVAPTPGAPVVLGPGGAYSFKAGDAAQMTGTSSSSSSEKPQRLVGIAAPYVPGRDRLEKKGKGGRR